MAGAVYLVGRIIRWRSYTAAPASQPGAGIRAIDVPGFGADHRRIGGCDARRRMNPGAASGAQARASWLLARDCVDSFGMGIVGKLRCYPT